jgi:hypothetical protein
MRLRALRDLKIAPDVGATLPAWIRPRPFVTAHLVQDAPRPASQFQLPIR